MLVLGRKVGEKILISDNITVTVLEVRGDRVRLGFDAEKSIPIHRAEVAEQISEFKHQPVHAEGGSGGPRSESANDLWLSVPETPCMVS